MKVSECCGAYPIQDFESGLGYDDIGICSDCKEHCEYIEEEDV